MEVFVQPIEICFGLPLSAGAIGHDEFGSINRSSDCFWESNKEQAKRHSKRALLTLLNESTNYIILFNISIVPFNPTLIMTTRLRSRPSKSNLKQDTQSRIIAAATKLFATKGYDGTSIKSICEKAKVNIAAIHYHFSSKDALFCHIIAAFGGERVQSVERILLGPETAEELRLRLEMFLGESLNVFIRQPDLCRIVQTEIEQLHSRSEAAFRDTFVTLAKTLESFLTRAKEKSLLSSSIDPQIAAHFLFNQLRLTIRADGVNSKYFGFSIKDEAYRSLWIKQTLQVFLEGIVAS